MVNPGGTGSPALVISARPAPLAPSTSFILPSPSALPPPNEYTYLVPLVFVSFFSVSGSVIVAIIRPLLFRGFFGAFGHDLGKISDGGKFLQQRLQQCEPVGAHFFVIDHHHYFIEKLIYDRAQLGDFEQRLLVILLLAKRLDGFCYLRNLRGEFFFCVFF